MSNKEIFSKFIPNIKLQTRFDADGNEIEEGIREDVESEQKRKEILDLLLSSGYFRARIKILSDFDKVIGGMTWCIEACDFDVDVDLLFHENLSIGQKISLTEKIVGVLPLMKCPFIIEPHQIQGLDFINIWPVIQWLVKLSVQKRTEKAERLKLFAISQFHNHFTLSSTEQTRRERNEVLNAVKKVESMYVAQRQYRRKKNIEPLDEKSRVRLTLLEYGIRNNMKTSSGSKLDKSQSINKDSFNDELQQDEVCVETYEHASLTEQEKSEIAHHYENLKSEMLIDTKELSEQSKIRSLEALEAALEKRLLRTINENKEISEDLLKDAEILESLKDEVVNIEKELLDLEVQENEADLTIKSEIKELILQNENQKQNEIKFKENCNKELAELHDKIEESEKIASKPDEDLTEYEEMLQTENNNLVTYRLQLAKRNRAVTSVQRQLDNIPDNIELSQYQRRFLELYNQISAKHKETKQFYALYNTLNDTKLYLEKELMLLNSIYENYNQAMTNQQSKEQFIKKLEDIVEGVVNTKIKIKRKNDDEKFRQDELNSELLSFVDVSRKYALMVKQFKIVCQRT
ncbi:unnamed protein product [Diamesa serratosioi]